MSTTTQQTERRRARVLGPRVGSGKPTVREARRGWILATLRLAQHMISLDVLTVNVALAVAAAAVYLVGHTGQANAAAHAATHSYDVVFMVSAVVLLTGSLLIGTLTHGELPGHEVISSASRPHNHQGAVRGNGQPS